jgi:nitrate/nitrite-specific signal transduction histidine kinase
LRISSLPTSLRQAVRRVQGRLVWRLTVLLVLFAGSLLIPVGAGLIWLSFHSQRQAIARTQTEIARQAAVEVSAFLTSVNQSLILLAQTQDLANLEAAGQQHALYQLLKTVRTFDELSYLDASGHERTKVSPYHTFTAEELLSQADHPGFLQALRGEPFISGVNFSQYSGQPIVWLAQPVTDMRQENAGVLLAQVNFRRMWDIVTGLEVGETGYAYVVDGQGQLIAYRDISPVLRREELSRLPTVAGFLEGRPVTAEYRGLSGQQVIGAQVPIAATPWAVVVELPVAEAYTTLYRMATLLGLLLLLAVAMAVVVGVRLGGYIVRPIETLQAGAAHIGAGNLNHTIELQTGDELEALAGAFNAMSRNLLRSQAEIERWNRRLEKRVTQQTAALHDANLQLKALARVSQSINAVLALPAALEAVAEATRTVLGTGRCAVYLLEAETGELHCVLAHGLSPGYVQTVSLYYRQIPAQDVLTAHRPQIITDAAHDPRLAPIQATVRAEGYHSVVLLPLVHSNESLGFLALYHETPRSYSEDELELAQTFANQAAIAIKNARLFDTIHERASQLSALYAVATSVSQTLELDQVLNDALDTILPVMQANVGWIYLVDDEMEGLMLAAYRAPEGTAAPEADWLPFGAGLSGSVAAGGASVLFGDEGDTAAHDMPAGLRHHFRSVMVTPLSARSRVVGVLGVATTSPAGRLFGQREADLLNSIGQQMGIAVENARLYDESREVAVLAERNRLAREFHDTLVQDLAGIVLQLEAAERLATRQPEATASTLERARKLARRSLEEARRSLWNLRPTPLEHLSLAEALRQAAGRLNEPGGLQASFRLSGAEHRLPPHVELNLYRIAQEALTNVRKHAGASRVTVVLDFEPGRVQLSVSDDGRGDLDTAFAGGDGHSNVGAGWGVRGIQERTLLLNGRLEINSSPGRGTQLMVAVPLANRAMAPAHNKGNH